MRLTDDFNDEPNNGTPFVYMTMGGVFFVFAILAVVLFMNRESRKSTVYSKTETAETATQESAEVQYAKSLEEKTVDELISGSKLTSDQLDIWGEMPPVNVQDNKQMQTTEAEEKIVKKEETEEVTEEDLSNGGTKTAIKNSKGEEEWITINPYLTKNKYDVMNLVYQAPLMEYFENEKKISYAGVDISKEQGYVDYNRLKKQGISYVMIRCGSRGYGSGKLTIDEYFQDNMKGATDAGLEVGLIFCSQAATEKEAVEEARLALECIGEYQVKYPIAFMMETIHNDVSRTDALTKKERSKVANAFMAIIKQEGYLPILSGSKEWLITQVDLMQLMEYDIWLMQEKEVPDYPYKFSMWQYTTNGKIDGIEGKANLNISFIDYRLK